MPRTYSARIYRSYFSNEFGSVDLAYGDGGRAQILPHTVVEWARRNPSVALTIDATPTVAQRRALAKRTPAERKASTRAKWAAMQAAKAVR